jgi:5-methyltetrahydropteroyltriglutamate--homocysteine methyltransferase
VIKGVDGIRIGIHICRGNWSKKDDVLLTGDYGPLLPALKKMKVKQFVLEYATPRAGDIDIVGKELADREIGLGVVNPRTNIPESPEEIVRKAEKALNFYKPRL